MMRMFVCALCYRECTAEQIIRRKTKPNNLCIWCDEKRKRLRAMQPTERDRIKENAQ